MSAVRSDLIGHDPNHNPVRHRENTGDDHVYIRSIAMHSMNEALARDRMREQMQRSRENSLAHELAAQRRWHRVSLYARAAEKRHAARVRRAPVGR